MKRRIFDLRLWREGMRQLSLIGIMTFIVMELTAILVPVGYFISWQQSIGTYNESYGISALSGSVGQPLLVLMPCVVAPLMTLYLFRFLNKRSASDFYHQFPVKRTCLYFSFFAAIAVWMTAITAISALTGQMMFRLLLSARYTLMGIELWIYAFNMLAGGLLVAAVATVAMSVTGSVFNNIVSTLSLLYVPRLILLVFSELLIDNLWVLPSDTIFPLLSVHYNVPAGMLQGLFVGQAGKSLTDPYAGLYTLFVALLYMLLAAWLFSRRKSEAAEHASLNRWVQALLRITIGFVIALIPCVLLVEGDGDMDSLFWVVVVYIIALVVMMCYELITTRRWRNLPRAFGSFGIVLLLSALFIGGEALGRELVLMVEPTAEQITGVQFVEDGDFFDYRVSELTFEEKEVHELVSTGLSQAIARERGENLSDETSDVVVYDKDTLEVTDSLNDYSYARIVKIRMGLYTVTRRIRLNHAQDQALGKAMTANEEYRRMYSELPEWGTPGFTVMGNTVPDKVLRAVYESLRRSVADWDFDDWYAFLNNQPSSLLDSKLNLYLTLTIRGNKYTRLLAIPWEFSEACQMAISATNEERETLARWLETDGYTVNYVGIQPLPSAFKDCGDSHFSVSEYDDDVRTWLLELLKSETSPSVNGRVVELQVQGDTYMTAASRRYSVYVSVDHTNLWAYRALTNRFYTDFNYYPGIDLHNADAVYCEVLEGETYRRVEITGVIDSDRVKNLCTGEEKWTEETAPGSYGSLRLVFEGEYLNDDYDTTQVHLYPDMNGSGMLLLSADPTGICSYVELYPMDWKELLGILARYEIHLDQEADVI